MSNKMTLSVTIITKNEEDRIRCCLDSVKGLADEIIVLDSGSMDRTLEIVAEYTDKIYKTDWPGFGIQKQRALEKASCDWVLAIDADEALDEDMQQWLKTWLITDRNNVAGVKMPWGVMAYGKRLDYGRSARAPLRMAWREGAKFTDAEVHEEFIPAAGEIAIAQGRLLHYSNRDYGHALQKNIDYAWLGSQKYFRQGKRCNSLTLATLRSLWTFVHIYIVRGGILDGPVGYLVAINYAQNNFHKYAGLWALTRADKKSKMG